MKEQASFLGMLIRNERLKRGLELKDVADGICAPSYLCKIELGQAKASAPLLADILARLHLHYEMDETFLREMTLVIDRVYEGIFYNYNLTQEQKVLTENAARLLASPLRLSYEITKAYLNDHPVENQANLANLANLVPYMDDREHALYLLTSLDYEGGRASLAQAKKADDLLQNSFSLLAYMSACLQNNRYEEIKSIGDSCIVRSLQEGNLHSLIQTNMLLGTGYASEGHISVAITYYERASHLIRGSLFPHLEQTINYNLGATYLEIGDIDKAATLLRKVPRTYGFYLYHKLAWLALAKAAPNDFLHELSEMKKTVDGDRARELIYQATAIQLHAGFESDPRSLAVVENLIRGLAELKHNGYLQFHRALITRVFVAHRKYKQAYEFERMLGEVGR